MEFSNAILTNAVDALDGRLRRLEDHGARNCRLIGVPRAFLERVVQRNFFTDDDLELFKSWLKE